MKNLGVVLVVAIFLLLAGCAASERGPNSLALGGYRSVEIRDVVVTVDIPYDRDRFADEVRLITNNLFRGSMAWSNNGAKPQALVTVEIVSFSRPSKASRVVWGIPHRVGYVLRATDADSQQPLGATSGTVKLGVPMSALTGGVGAIAVNSQWDKAMAGSYGNQLAYALGNEFSRKASEAKRRPAPQPSNVPPFDSTRVPLKQRLASAEK